MKKILLLLLFFAVSVWSTALGQSKAVATVEVKDPSGAAVAGAEVTLVATSSSETPRVVLRTDRSGAASVDLLPGTYDLSVKSTGFEKLSKQVVITETKRQTFSVVLQLGRCSPCPEVTGLPATVPYRLNYSEFLRMNGVIVDGDTAADVALAIFKTVFGKQYSVQFVPYHAQFNNGVWTVYGTLPQGSRGGTPMLKIQKSDGKVLEVWLSQ